MELPIGIGHLMYQNSCSITVDVSFNNSSLANPWQSGTEVVHQIVLSNIKYLQLLGL